MEKNEMIELENVESLNAVPLKSTFAHIDNIVSMLNLPRDIIATNDEINFAWKELPREIERIPTDLRDELVARMCIATSVGLFDGAINYIWNATIVALRSKVLNFGLPFVAETLGRSIDESGLYDLRDSELLDICYKLELLTEDGYMLLNQNREIRNKFSVAHPNIANIDDRELINFVSRCCKYGITDDYILKGIYVPDFIKTVKHSKLDEDAIFYWTIKIKESFAAQRQMLIPMLMSFYCDSTSNESTRLNCIRIAAELKDSLDDKTKSIMIERYNNYYVSNESDKVAAGKNWFERLGLLNLLSESEQHSLVKSACDNLQAVHDGMNNFYNEPPFAQRLYEISNSLETPQTIQEDFVYTVVTCYVGNFYGVSNAAVPYYQNMIENFSPREISYMIGLLNDNQSYLTYKVKNFGNCKKRFKDALNLLEKDSMDASQQATLKQLLNKL